MSRNRPVRMILPLLLLGPGCRLQERTEGVTSLEAGREAALAKDHTTAVNQYTLAIEGSRDRYFFTEAYLERGETFLAAAEAASDSVFREQCLDDALKDFERVLAEEGVEPAARTRALSSRGKALLARGDAEGAEASFRDVLLAEGETEEDSRRRLEARRRLGWIAFERAEKALAERTTAEEQAQLQERFREAQDQFSSGLEIDEDDWDLNLGKGMCLHFRGQHLEAMSHLERSTRASSARGVPNHKGHYYLARAIESHKEYHTKALEHYRKALIQDTERSFRPLYERLLEVLPIYLSPGDADFSWFLDQLLAYRPEDRKYWDSVEAFAMRISSGGPPAENNGTFTLAVARARNGKTDLAVKDAVSLADQPNFLESILRIFPSHDGRPEHLHGRALTLFEAKRHVELESFFEEEVFDMLEPAAMQTEEYQKTLVIEGRNIVALWAEEAALTGPPRDPDARLERDRRLGKARDAFVAYLEIHRAEHDVRMALGEVQEMMESYPAALLSYAYIVHNAEDRDKAVLKILKLHKEKLLPEDVSRDAWSLLRGYEGLHPEIDDYVRTTREQIAAEIRLYCAGCGRKGADGDRMCFECGRSIRRIAQPAEVR